MAFQYYQVESPEFVEATSVRKIAEAVEAKMGFVSVSPEAVPRRFYTAKCVPPHAPFLSPSASVATDLPKSALAERFIHIPRPFSFGCEFSAVADYENPAGKPESAVARNARMAACVPVRASVVKWECAWQPLHKETRLDRLAGERFVNAAVSAVERRVTQYIKEYAGALTSESFAQYVEGRDAYQRTTYSVDDGNGTRYTVFVHKDAGVAVFDGRTFFYQDEIEGHDADAEIFTYFAMRIPPLVENKMQAFLYLRDTEV